MEIHVQTKTVFGVNSKYYCLLKYECNIVNLNLGVSLKRIKANSADIEQTPLNAASDQGLHYLCKTDWYFLHNIKLENSNDKNKLNQTSLKNN